MRAIRRGLAVVLIVVCAGVSAARSPHEFLGADTPSGAVTQLLRAQQDGNRVAILEVLCAKQHDNSRFTSQITLKSFEIREVDIRGNLATVLTTFAFPNPPDLIAVHPASEFRVVRDDGWKVCGSKRADVPI